MSRHKSNTEWMRARLLAHVDDSPVGVEQRNPVKIGQARWSEEFETYMKNRLGFGHFRYGLKVDAGACFAQVTSAIARLRKYLETGNQEHLVDAANLAMMEYVHPCEHDDPHFEASDDGEHTEEM